MADFTSTQADACKIVRMEQKKNGSSHVSWVFGVVDGDKNYYDWEDLDTSATASKSTIKTAIKNKLLTMGKLPLKVIPTYINIDNKGKGEIIG